MSPSSEESDCAVDASATTKRPTQIRKPTMHAVPQSVAPVMDRIGSNTDIYGQIDNSLISAYLDTDSYMAKASTGITNSKALHVSPTPLSMPECATYGEHAGVDRYRAQAGRIWRK